MQIKTCKYFPTWIISLLVFHYLERCSLQRLPCSFPPPVSSALNCFIFSPFGTEMKYLKWITSLWQKKKPGFNSDMCNQSQVQMHYFPPVQPPIQACQFGKFQKPVDFIINSISHSICHLCIKVWRVVERKKTCKKIHIQSQKPLIIARIKEPVTTDRRC